MDRSQVGAAVRASRLPWVVGLLIVTTALRLLVAAALPLTEDEAYYRLWAQHPAFGYFDHPPMIAWWIWAGVRLLGDTAAGVRLLPTLACGLTGLVLYRLTPRLTAAPKVAGRAVLWHQATLLVGLGGMLATPDAPTTLFWILGAWLAVEAERGARGLWLAAGAMAGLAMLSKYSAIFMPVGVLLWMTARQDGRRLLRTPWPWLAAGVALCLFSLNGVWNAHHGWLTFDKQFGRAIPHGVSPGGLLEFIGGQAILLNPLICVFVVRGLAELWRTRRAPPPALLVPVLMSAPFAAYLLAHSLHDRVEAHWPAPLYPFAAMVAAFAAGKPLGRAATVVRRWAPASLGMITIIFVLAAAPRIEVPEIARWTLPVRDWPQFGRAVETARRQHGAAWVGTLSYGVVSQLRFVRQIDAPVVQITERDRYPHDDVPSAILQTRPGLIVDLQRRLDMTDLARCFGRVTPLPGLDRGGAKGPSERYFLVLVAAPRRDIAGQGCWGGKTP